LPTYEDWHAWRLLRRGAHAARVDLPFHMSRRVPGQRSGDGFFSTDLDHDRDVFRQAVEDAAAVVAWARREVTSRVAVLGFSLGGLVACLLAAVVPLDAVVAVTPPCDLAETMLERSPSRIRRQLGLVGGSGGPWGTDAAAARGVLDAALAPVTPRLLHPVTDPARIAVVCAEYDGIVGAGPVRQLATAWGAELLEYRHGHISVMSARGITRRLHDRLLRSTPVTAPAAAV
jgi:dienelactone hydrolase